MGGRISGGALVVGVVLFGLFLVISLPDNILTHSTLFQRYTDVMASLVPTIDQITNISTFPQVTRLFLSVMWTLVPVVTVLILRLPGILHFQVNKIKENKFLYTASFIFLPFMIVFVAMFLIAADGADSLEGGMLHELILRNISHSKIWLGFFGSLMMLVLSFVLSGFLKWTCSIKEIYFE